MVTVVPKHILVTESGTFTVSLSTRATMRAHCPAYQDSTGDTSSVTAVLKRSGSLWSWHMPSRHAKTPHKVFVMGPGDCGNGIPSLNLVRSLSTTLIIGLNEFLKTPKGIVFMTDSFQSIVRLQKEIEINVLAKYEIELKDLKNKIESQKNTIHCIDIELKNLKEMINESEAYKQVGCSDG